MSDVVLKDQVGNDETYSGVDAVLLNTADGGTAVFHNETSLTADKIQVNNTNVKAVNVDAAITELVNKIGDGGSVDASDVTYTPTAPSNNGLVTSGEQTDVKEALNAIFGRIGYLADKTAVDTIRNVSWLFQPTNFGSVLFKGEISSIASISTTDTLSLYRVTTSSTWTNETDVGTAGTVYNVPAGALWLAVNDGSTITKIPLTDSVISDLFDTSLAQNLYGSAIFSGFFGSTYEKGGIPAENIVLNPPVANVWNIRDGYEKAVNGMVSMNEQVASLREQIDNLQLGGGGSVSEEEDILPEQDLVMTKDTESNGTYTFMHIAGEDTDVYKNAYMLEPGDTCYVVWDGTEYICNVTDVSSDVPSVDGTINKCIAFGKLDEAAEEPFSFSLVDVVDNNGTPLARKATLQTTTSVDAESVTHKVRIYKKAPLKVSWDNVTNKPFYETETVIFSEQTITFDESDNMYLINPHMFDLVVGNTYKVIWDGVEYTLVAFMVDGIAFIGNDIVVGGFDNGVPFVIGYAPEEANIFMPISASGTPPSTATVSIAEIVCKTLDPKFSPIPLSVSDAKTVEALAATTIPFSIDTGIGLYTFSMTPSASNLEMWESDWTQAIISWDGTEYICGPQNIQGIKLVGNADVIMGSGDNGIPFVFGIGNIGDGVMIYIFDMYTTIPEGTTEGSITHQVGVSLEYPERIVVEPDSIPDIDYESMVVRKPFGTIKAGEIIASGTVSCTQSNGTNGSGQTIYVGFADKIDFVGGCTYIVEVNGVSEELVALSGDGISGVEGTNAMIINIPSAYPYNTIFWGIVYGNVSYKISAKEEIVKKIDEKYLPDSSGLPDVTTSDNNKVMTVVNGQWAAQTPASGLPAVTTSDNGKVLKVVNGVWTKTAGVPTVTSSDNGKILKVVNGAWSTQTETKELPTVYSSDAGKVLRVSSSGTWVAEKIPSAEGVSF